MAGDNRVRFCQSCKQNVYDVSELNDDEVGALVFAHEGRLCVRMRVRPDGTLVSKDCRSRLRALKAKGTWGVVVFLILIVPVAVGSYLARASKTNRIDQPPSHLPSPGMMMGKPLMMDNNTPY